MKKLVTISCVGSVAAIISVFLYSLPAGGDEVYPFRVAFEDLPGVDHLLAGDLARGIRVLEKELESGASREDHVLATLCGAYILAKQLASAERACADAIERFGSDTAYNNRGVLRAFRGDLEGARRDFARASPPDMDAYMNILRMRDVGLVAGSNHKLLQRLSLSHSGDEVRRSSAPVVGAEIETIDY